MEIMSEYGAEAWRMYNTVLTQMLENSQKQLAELRFVWPLTLLFLKLQEVVFVCFRKKVQEVTWQRKSEQTRAGETLRNLEER